MPAGPIKTYALADVRVIYGGVPIQGFADGDVITIERPEAFTTQVGAGGAVTRSRTNNPTSRVTIRLQQTSRSNAVIEGFSSLDRATGLAALPLIIKDLLGNDLFMAAEAWVASPANITFGAESGVREWVFDCNGVAGVAGGAS